MHLSRLAILFFLASFFVCCNDSRVNSYSLIISVDDLEVYQHPLKEKADLRPYRKLFGFNVKKFIEDFSIQKTDTVLIKMEESADCVPKAVNLQQLLNEELANVFIVKFDGNDESILGFKNELLFDTTKHLKLFLPKDE